MKNIKSLQMLPRFNSQEKISQSNEKIQLPRFQSDHKRNYYDENRSADTKINIKESQDSNKFHIKFLERAYDRFGKKCWPMINTNVGKIDLEYTYEIVGNTLESYIHCRKLNRCKALSNFIEYRNKIFKREKIAQYALSEPKTEIKEIHTKQMKNIPTKIIHIEEEQTPSISPSSLSTISEIRSPTPIPSLQSITHKSTQKLSPPTTKESFIPIPSPDLLRSPSSKQSKISIPKKTNSTIKKLSAPSVKGQS